MFKVNDVLPERRHWLLGFLQYKTPLHFEYIQKYVSGNVADVFEKSYKK